MSRGIDMRFGDSGHAGLSLVRGRETRQGGSVKFGLFGINLDVLGAEPREAVRVARVAEEFGWESVWTGEHYVLPEPWEEPAPAGAGRPMLDPFVALTNVAAHTTKLLLGTGLTVVPYHQPLVLAKKVASLERVSGGRFLFGVGVGYLPREFAALGVPMRERGERLRESLEAMEAIWAGRPASYDGKYVRFENVGAEPRPAAVPPVHFGGGVERTFQRVVTKGKGWFGFGLDLEETRAAVGALRRAQERYERPAELGPVEISVTPAISIDEDTVARFAELGVTRLIPLAPREARRDAERIIQFVREVGERFCRT